MLVFDPKVGIYSEDTTVTRERIANDWMDAFFRDGSPQLATDAWTPAGQLIDAQAALVAEKDADVLRIGSMMDPTQAEGIWQDAMMKWFGIRRRTDKPSTVQCVCRGLPGTVIPRGSLVSTKDGNQKFFSGKRAIIGKDGTAAVEFAYENPGPYTFNAGVVNRIITLVPGWDSVINPANADPGTILESDEDLEGRRQKLLAINAQGSLPAMYSGLWEAMGQVANTEVDGEPYFLKIQDNDTSYPVPWRVADRSEDSVDIIIPPHSMCIVMLGGEDDKIAEAIYRNKSSGSGTYGNHKVSFTDDAFYGLTYTYEIVRPEPLQIDVEIIVESLTGQPGDYEGLGRAAIYGEWRYSWEIVASGTFFCPVQKAGIQTLLDIKIKSPRDFDGWVDIVKVPGLYYPVLGAVTVVARR